MPDKRGDKETKPANNARDRNLFTQSITGARDQVNDLLVWTSNFAFNLQHIQDMVPHASIIMANATLHPVRGYTSQLEPDARQETVVERPVFLVPCVEDHEHVQLLRPGKKVLVIGK